MKSIFYIMIAGMVALFLLPFEMVWVVLVAVIIFCCFFQTSRKIVGIPVAIAGIAVLVGHFTGHKLYGRPELYDNRPVLEAPHQVASFALPNFLILTNGTRLEVKGVTFNAVITELSPQAAFNQQLDAVLVQRDDASPSGITFQRRNRYFCGNSFFPRFLPKRLPRYQKADAGRSLVGLSLASKDQ